MDDNPIPWFTEADLSESERAVYDRGEAVLRTIPGNPAYGRWIIPRSVIDACLEGWRICGRYDGGGDA
jgi:hypothetical protein